MSKKLTDKQHEEEEALEIKSGRKPIPVDEKLMEKLSKFQLSDKLIADCCGISVWTLNRRFAQKVDFWKSQGKCKIADVLFDEAISRRKEYAVKMVAQKHLGYSERVEKTVRVTDESELDKLTVDEIKEQIKLLTSIDE